MNKIIAAFLCVSLATLAACSSAPASSSSPSSVESLSSAGSSSSKASAPAPSSGQGLEVDKGLLDVTITFPASMFEGGEGISDDEIKSAEAKGIKVTKNDDGSVTYKMSKSTHKKLMEETKKSTAESLDKIATGGDYESISGVAYNDDFSQISLKVNKEKYENSLDSFAALNAGLQGMFYQVFDGKKEDTMKVKVDFIDEKTGGVLDTVTYPDALKESSSSK